MGQHVHEVGKITCPVSFQNAFAGRANADIRVYPGVGHNFSMPRKQGYDAAVAKEPRAQRAQLLQGHVRRVTRHR